MKKKLIFYDFPKELSKNEKRSFFDLSFEKIINSKILDYHKKIQKKFIKALKELYILSNGNVYFKFFYFDTLDDFSFFYDKYDIDSKKIINEYGEKIVNPYSNDEKDELRKLILRLNGRELILKKLFKLKNEKELEILIKFQLRTFRTVLIYFRDLHCIVYGRDEYLYEIRGKYNNEEIFNILKRNKLIFFEADD